VGSLNYPILYSATETEFDHNGLGILGDCVSCKVTEEANGAFELAMEYPADGIHFENITDRAIIKAKPDQFRDPQLFRIYSINKPMSSVVKVLAQHISYDLSGIPVRPFSANNVLLALQGLKSNAVVDCPFEFYTDKITSADFSVDVPSSIRSMLGGSAGSILSVYGGEYEFDNYTVKLHNNRGMNRGVSIRYGKNLTNIKQDQNCANVVTGIYPYWASAENGELVELPEKIINAPGEYNFVKIKTVDFSTAFENKPTVDQLREVAEEYVENNEIGVPVVSMTISFTQLAQYDEYKHLKLLERVSLFDTVNVEFPALKVSATAKAVKVVYDVLANRVLSVTLGSVRPNIADTIAIQQAEIDRKPDKTFLELAVEHLTKTILGAKGGSVRLLDTNEDGEPDTLYIADNPDPTQAVKVWRFNYEGWGASENGYNGPFKMGATLDGGIVADFITAGTLYGLLFKAGFIESLDGKIVIDLNSGKMPIFNTGIQTNNEFIVMNEIGQHPMFTIKRLVNSWGKEYFDISGYDGEHSEIFRITRGFDSSDGTPIVTALELKSGSSMCDVSTTDYEQRILFSGNAGSLSFGVNNSWGSAYISLPQDRARKLSWGYSEELKKYVLCGE
jgi:phage minor structural protein